MGVVDDIASRLDPTDVEAARADALMIFGLMVGTLQLARALTDRHLSDQLLARGEETALSCSTSSLVSARPEATALPLRALGS